MAKLRTLPDGAVYAAEIIVFPNSVSIFHSSLPATGWVKTKEAMQRAANQLLLTIARGHNCPFAPKTDKIKREETAFVFGNKDRGIIIREWEDNQYAMELNWFESELEAGLKRDGYSIYSRKRWEAE